MRQLPFIPALIITATAGFSALAAAAVLWLAALTPWLGVTLTTTGATEIIVRSPAPGIEAGSVLLALGLPGQKPIPLEARDLVSEPDVLPTYGEIETFYQRQGQLVALLSAPAIEAQLQAPDGSVKTLSIEPAPRPLWTLPVSFWIQLVTGVVSALISGWVWALRPRQLAPTLFALSGLGVLMVTLTSAFYAHRGLALPTQAYGILMPINHLGILFFGGGLIGLFLIYPKRLLANGWLLLIPAALGPFYLFDTLHAVIEADVYSWTVPGFALAILALIALQWWTTRGAPDQRAVLGWLGLSVASAVGIFGFLGIAPSLLGTPDPLTQHYAAGSIILIYLGLALGLRRYRLFELGDWAYRILFYMLGAFVLLGLDAALLAGLNLDFAPALAISLLLLALVYLPLREWIRQRLFARQPLQQHELFSAAMDVAFAPSRADSAIRWRALLSRLFDPLETTELADPPPRPQLDADGLAMDLPAVAGAPGLRLRFPFGGSGLFQPGHLSLAIQMLALTERAEESRLAYMRGVGEERRRMARDLHDDVGARLLSGLHTADERTRSTLQAALGDIRTIVSGLTGEEAELDRVLAETRHETARRLEAVGIELDWPLSDQPTPELKFDYRVHKALTSGVREIVSNVIRHSGARRLAATTRFDGDLLVLSFTDDGAGLPPQALTGDSQGFGLKNLRQRLGDIGGTVGFDGDTGTRITLTLPLRSTEPWVQQSPAALDLST